MNFDRDKLTTYEQIEAEVITSIVETSSGRFYEIQAVMPGDILKAVGSPLLSVLTEKGINLEDQEEAEKHIRGMAESDQVDLVSDPEFLSMAREMVCVSVISINLVQKPPKECSKELKEVSIDRLDLQEIIELFTMAMTVSIPESDIKDFYSFREDFQEEENGPGETTPDGEILREETDGIAIQEEEPVSTSSLSPG